MKSGKAKKVLIALDYNPTAQKVAEEGFRKHLDDKKIKTVVEEGNLAEVILKTAETLRSDIIIMGSHSQKWLENIIMGSVTEKVIRHSRIPVFIIPTRKVS